ncbi:MAG: septal ring lytic transglycosylase RlpA family protein [Gemmatimonadota bacterium]
MGRSQRLAALPAALLLGGCTMIGSQGRMAPSVSSRPPAGGSVASIPDIIPSPEPPAGSGNMVSYEQNGHRYRVLDWSYGYDERGKASWYGEDFHGRNTSSGEPYDMYKLTAAHRTLPLPSFVRVTNLDNGQAVVLRVNDRGPFADTDSRIIDVSYAAAVRLGMVGTGTANVRVEAIQPWQYRVE